MSKMKSLTTGLFIAALAVQARAADIYRFEEVPANEKSSIDQIANLTLDVLKKDHQANPTDIVHRDAHAKAHGCVKAEFEIRPDLPQELQIGLFSKPGAKYSAWVRYSNGNGHAQSDHSPDGRGMAVKVMGVPGTKILAGQENASTQDFLMINHTVFFVKDAADYVEFQSDINTKGDPKSFFLTRPREAFNAARTAFKPIQSPLTSQYWSMTPSLLGEQKAVKYSAKPCDGSVAILPSSSSDPNFLRAALKSQLEQGDACYQLMVQVAPVQKKTVGADTIISTDDSFPVEDPRIEWSEWSAPFQTVAFIHMPKQTFDSPEQEATCENLSFTPWHSLPEHRPLGGINRVRKTVYEAISTYRHATNGVERVEP